MSSEIQTPNEILYPASEATALTLDLVKHVQGGNLRGIPFGTTRLNRDVMPAMPGDLVLVCARPGNGKTFFVQHMLGNVIDSIIAEKDGDGAVVYITWETSVEQAAAAWLAQSSGISSTVSRGRSFGGYSCLSSIGLTASITACFNACNKLLLFGIPTFSISCLYLSSVSISKSSQAKLHITIR